VALSFCRDKGIVVPAEPQEFITRPLSELFGRHPGYGFAGIGVSTAIGNYTETDVDLSSPGSLSGLLDWTRTYNSLSTDSGVLGRGWATSFGASLELAPPGSPGSVQFHDVDGRVLTFTPEPAGAFNRPQDLDADLIRNADGTFTLAFNSGAAWSFDANGRLTGKSAEGQTVACSYNPAGLLLQATHSSGTHLNFSYGTAGRLVQAETSDGRAASYAYDAAGSLSTVTLPGGGIIAYASTGTVIGSVTDPDGNLIVTNTYQADGRVSQQDLPSDGTIAFGYDTTSGVTTVTSTPPGAQATFHADSQGRLVGVTDPLGNASAFTYDANGRLISGATPAGTPFAQSFDSRGNVLTATFGGATTTWTYDSASRVTSETDPVGNTTTFTYAGTSRIPSAATAADGSVIRLEVADGLVTRRTDADGNTTIYSYDAAGNLISVTDPLGELWRFGYDAAGRRISFTTPSGAVTRFTYDAAGRMTASTDPSGAAMRYEYSASGLLLQTTDPTGAVYRSGYNSSGQLTSVTDPLGRTAAYEYDPIGNPLSFAEPAGGTSSAVYDALGRVASMTGPDGTVVQYTYDADGNQLTEQTPSGTSSTTYDARGNRISVTDPLGATTRYEYDAADRLVTTTYPDGAVKRVSYDAAGNVVASTDPLGAVTRWLFTPAGNIAAIIDPLGRETTYKRNAAGRVTEVTDPQGGRTRFAYDPDGRQISVTTPAGLLTTFRYNAAGRLDTVVNPRGWPTTYEYSARGERTAVIPPSGAIRRYRYDAAAQLIQSVDANGSTNGYDYDKAGRLTSVTDAKGAATHYTYDAAGRLLTVTDPLGRTTTRTYDHAGHLVTVTDPSGHVQRMDYDVDNRLVRKSAEGATDVTFTYDAAGRRASMTDATGTTHYSYDAAGRLLTVTDPDGGATTAGYDAAGQRISLAYPSGLELGYSYDLNGRLTRLSHPRAGNATYALDPDGRLLTEQLPGRAARRYHYEHGLLDRFTVIRDGLPASATSLTRDPDGRILTQRGDSWLRSYRYDPAGQLVSVSHQDFARHPDSAAQQDPPPTAQPQPPPPWPDQRLVYDAAGNRTGLQRGGSEVRYQYDAADQLLTAEADGQHITYQYDSCGRLTEETNGGRRRVISYDGFGLPVTISTTTAGDHTGIQAVYNGDGLLTSLTLSAGDRHGDGGRAASVHYRWGSAGQIPQILAQRTEPGAHDAQDDRAGQLTADFAYGFGRTFASWEHGTATFQHDIFGSAIRTDDTEAWVEASDYDPFGVPAPTAPGNRGPQQPELPRFGYRGELATGQVIYLRARLYDAALGRFTSRDPITSLSGPAQARNPYVYAANDPIRFIDPLGTAILVPGGQIGQLARGGSQPGSSGVPGTIAISQHVSVSAADPRARALQAAWRWVVGQFGAPHTADAEFSDWVRLCALRPYGFTCQGELARDFSLSSLNYSVEGAFHQGIKLFLSSIAAGSIAGFLFPLAGGIRPISNPVQQYEVGAYKDLLARSVPGDCLAIHHVPQGSAAAQVIAGFAYLLAPTIALENEEHWRIPNRRGAYTGTAQELIEEDVQKLRDIQVPEERVQALIDLIDSMYPGILPQEGEPAEGGEVPGAEGGAVGGE